MHVSIKIFFCFVVLIGSETFLRVNYGHLHRPSTLISLFATHISDWTYTIGWYLGEFSDIVYFVKKYFSNDLRALVLAFAHLFAGWTNVFSGFLAYYNYQLMAICVATCVLITVYAAVISFFRPVDHPVTWLIATYWHLKIWWDTAYQRVDEQLVQWIFGSDANDSNVQQTPQHRVTRSRVKKKL